MPEMVGRAPLPSTVYVPGQYPAAWFVFRVPCSVLRDRDRRRDRMNLFDNFTN